MYPGLPLDIDGLRCELSRYTIITFNGIGYDLIIIEAALSGYDNRQLKELSDKIILTNERIYSKDMRWVDHIDLMNVAPGKGSLKAYGGKMHTRRLQDLPIEPNASIEWPQRAQLREYCANDTQVTQELFDRFKSQIQLRVDIGAEYGIDVRSKSDPQIAEAVMKKILPFKVEIPQSIPGTLFYYRPPEWLSFMNLDLIERLNQLPFVINESGNVSPHYNADFIDWGDTQTRLNITGQFVKRPKDWEPTRLVIGNTAYTIGIGGLHSNESSVMHITDENYVLRDHDVVSYYPSLILRTGISPVQIGSKFLEIYADWYHRRLDAKAKKDKKTADSLKTFLNGTFGKLMSKYSIFYAPTELLQVTITGQLAILMLIEQMEYNGIPVISANTDGIVLKCPRHLEWLADSVLKNWEAITEFETERTDYTLLASRDVNSYCAIKPDGEVKLKGALAPAEPGASGWPNPTGQICVTAAVEYLKNGVSVEKTIKACNDIREFIYVRAVEGGGVLNTEPYLPNKTTQIKMDELLRLNGWGCIDMADRFKSKWVYAKDGVFLEMVDAYNRLVEESRSISEYLGKIVRWYMCYDSKSWIQYKNSGNQVPRTQGCKPIMDIPDTLPVDIDYDWYIKETYDLLTDIGAIKL